MTSVNTNTGAMTALMSLSATSTDLQKTEKQISTGYKVADATDDGAAYAVAQGVRSNVNVLSAVNNQLGSTQGLMSVTNSAMNSATTLMTKMGTDLANLADAATTTEQQAYQETYMQDVAQMASNLNGASYNGTSLIDKTNVTVTTSSAGVTSAAVTAAATTGPNALKLVQDESGTTYSINSFATQTGGAIPASGGSTGSFSSASDLISQLAALGASSATAQTALAAPGGTQTTGTYSQLQTQLNAQANTFAAQSSYINNQVTFNSSKIDSLNTGLGTLVDADLAAESAQLTSLQIKQQLGQQALSIANQAPSGLTSLFR